MVVMFEICNFWSIFVVERFKGILVKREGGGLLNELPFVVFKCIMTCFCMLVFLKLTLICLFIWLLVYFIILLLTMFDLWWNRNSCQIIILLFLQDILTISIQFSTFLWNWMSHFVLQSVPYVLVWKIYLCMPRLLSVC